MEQLSKSEKISLGTKEIAKRIRAQLKTEFKDCKFSVTIERYSGGSSISISVMETDFKTIKDFSEIQEENIQEHIDRRGYTREQLQKLQNAEYHQLNSHTLREEFNVNGWCNGVYLTEQGHNFLKRVVEIADYYNYNDSDMMTDYYSVNFSFDIQLGKWNKPFTQV